MDSINLLEELNSISKIHTLKRDDIDNLMVEFAQRILASLKIERMSVWLFNEAKDRVISMGEYDLPNKKFNKESTLLKAKYPHYFKSISENEILLVENVYRHPSTIELAKDYSLEKNVISLMDIPLRIGGELVGVICFEKTGSKERIFNQNEQTFALSIAIVFASSLEARQRRAIQNKLDHELHEKILLVKEVHHRVKNNLTIISSLINLQSNKVKDKYHKALFEEHRSKIDSIAVIHELVYKSKSFSEINIRNYLTEIVNNLQQAYFSDREEVSVIMDLEEIIVELNIALPIGLIINEVITNAFKHAFKGRTSGKISIRLHKNENGVKLVIADNGVGMELSDKKDLSLGMDILSGLVDQIDGKHTFENDQGLVFTMEFNLKA